MIKEKGKYCFSGYETIHSGEIGKEFVEVMVGDFNSKWAFACNVQGNRSGYCNGIYDRKLIYNSKQEALNRARTEILSEGTKHVPQVLIDKILDKMQPEQLELF